MAKARGIPPLGRTPNALPAPQAPAYLPMAKARGITQDLVIMALNMLLVKGPLSDMGFVLGVREATGPGVAAASGPEGA